MFLIRDNMIVTIFTVVISGAAGGLVATLYNAYYYEQVRKNIELEVRHKRDDNNSVSSKKGFQRDDCLGAHEGRDNTNSTPSVDIINQKEQELTPEEEKFYKELKDEIEVQEK